MSKDKQECNVSHVNLGRLISHPLELANRHWELCYCGDVRVIQFRIQPTWVFFNVTGKLKGKGAGR